ncbi:Uncharacterised protein [uncultured archaeon]|nr:Uncharacterised protein [uncultured archaeon]
MKEEKYNLKIIFCIGATILLVITTFLPLCISNFILPPQGGGMVHCDPQMSENIRLPVPTTNVGVAWYCHEIGGEKIGSYGNGIAGNGRIAASTFDNPSGEDNLILYDYYGNRIWSSENLLNWKAAASTPMVDIYDRVVACDNKRIILVDASDHNNVHVEWNKPIDIGSFFNSTLPISPTIVDNKTIVLPILNGPILAFNAQTGDQIAELTLGQNETINPYWGIPEMNWTNYDTIRYNSICHSICPFKYNSANHLIEWNSSIPFELMPCKNEIFIDNNIVYLVQDNHVTASWLWNHTELANNTIETGQIYTGEGFFSSINSICAKGNRIFVTTQYKKPGTRPFNDTIGRLYAIDVNPDATNESDRLRENWSYTFFGVSQASPTLIDDTLYFDGYNNTPIRQNRDPHIYAVYTNGTEKWKISYDNITLFSFARDPRGGFWYEDSDQIRSLFGGNTGGNKLVRFYEENGTEIKGQAIDMKTILNDSGSYKDKPVLPCSDMTTCGTETNPIMLISANHPLLTEGKWVLAIDLSNNNQLIWKVPIYSWSDFNYAGGQYTILNESGHYRVLFGTYVGGVMAIGEYPNCWFQNITYQLRDSPEDTNTLNDTVQVNYTIQTSLPDNILIEATLISEDKIHRYETERCYNISSPLSVTDNVNITLPLQAPEGMYKLNVSVYNSSGRVDQSLSFINIFDDSDTNYKADDT